MSEINILTKKTIEAFIQKPLPGSFPLKLRAVGEPDVLARRRVAIIGSRHPTFYGREQAAHFSRVLSENQVCVISGAAIGIDTIANNVAFHSGTTIAVLGSGLAVPYPSTNRSLFERMAHSRNALLVSEFDDHQVAVRWNFPKRNRIIAALCDFLLVIEAAHASGSMITARLAADFGVDVGALPGPVSSPTSQGSNHLIKEGAFCIERPEEILERLDILGHQRGILRGNSEHAGTDNQQRSLLF